jgi:hypothetical protein
MGAQTQHKARRKLGAPMQHKARPQVALPKMQGTSQGKRKARHVRKLGAQTQRKARPQDGRQTQNSSATKTSTQGSTRLKDELEDG